MKLLAPQHHTKPEKVIANEDCTVCVGVYVCVCLCWCVSVLCFSHCVCALCFHRAFPPLMGINYENLPQLHK